MIVYTALEGMREYCESVPTQYNCHCGRPSIQKAIPAIGFLWSWVSSSLRYDAIYPRPSRGSPHKGARRVLIHREHALRYRITYYVAHQTNHFVSATHDTTFSAWRLRNRRIPCRRHSSCCIPVAAVNRLVAHSLIASLLLHGFSPCRARLLAWFGGCSFPHEGHRRLTL